MIQQTFSFEEIHQQALKAARDYHLSEGSLIQALGLVKKARVFEKLGYLSLHDYCRKALRLSESHTYTLRQILKKSDEVPQLEEKIARGEITMSNARRIIPHLTVENQQEWLEKAATLSEKKLEREIKKDSPVPPQKERIRPVSAAFSELTVVISIEIEEQLKRVQDLLAQKNRRHVGIQETLGILLSEYIERKDPVEKAIRQKDKLAGKPTEVPAAANGKRTPKPAAITHRVNLRDRGQCTHIDAKGHRCTQTRWTEQHHLHLVSHHGVHSEKNLTTLCAAHHRHIHLTKASNLEFALG